MVAKIMLCFVVLFVVLPEILGQCEPLCPVVKNRNCLCLGKAQQQCVCDFTCSEWDKPCNWVVTCMEEIENINAYRDVKGKLMVLRLPNRSRDECLAINVMTHNRKNCCNKFCQKNKRDTCF
ncbi:hypothetical protein KR018_001032 [Drosophila ironensis]|nr:hypothetical protein KR018_001032 [Drosophila ironensis]